ncbi:hypothetical protein V6N13_082308 [Hibiscus sabdariffa]|uniref:Uncharacterized protein n=1 Tax=Hibiscus sabdariffa TaxID=183260 RepID=A0ABR2Q306_9ROSI
MPLKNTMVEIGGRHERHPWSQQLKSRFDSLKDLDHPLPLDLRSRSMRRMRSEKADVEAKFIAANRLNRVFVVVDLRLLKQIRSPVLNGIVDVLKDYKQGMGGGGKMSGLNYERSEEVIRYGWLSNFNAIIGMVQVSLSDLNCKSSDEDIT